MTKSRRGRRSRTEREPTKVASDGFAGDLVDERVADDPPLDMKSSELNDGLGYGADDGPESQGATAGHGFGQDAQGTFSDEDYDLSYGPKGLAGPEDVDESEHGADTPERIGWDETGDAADVVANEERDVATGDLSALQEVRKRTGWARRRPDDRIREEITEALIDLGVDDVGASVTNGEVVLVGAVATDEQRDEIDALVQDVSGVRAIDNRIVVRDDG
jgi:hypothetical protein